MPRRRLKKPLMSRLRAGRAADGHEPGSFFLAQGTLSAREIEDRRILADRFGLWRDCSRAACRAASACRGARFTCLSRLPGGLGPAVRLLR